VPGNERAQQRAVAIGVEDAELHWVHTDEMRQLIHLAFDREIHRGDAEKMNDVGAAERDVGALDKLGLGAGQDRSGRSPTRRYRRSAD